MWWRHPASFAKYLGSELLNHEVFWFVNDYLGSEIVATLGSMSDHVGEILEQWRNQRPDLDASSVGVFGRITLIERRKASALRDVHRRHGIDAAEYDILAALRRSGPPHALTPTGLSRGVLVTSATMTERLDRLERRGLVRRTRSDRDRRSVSVELTAEGREVIDGAVVDLLSAEAGLLEGLTVKDRRDLAKLLAKLSSHLETVSDVR